MDAWGTLIAGCSPDELDCSSGTIPNGLDAWFVALVLVVLVALIAGGVMAVALLVRRRRQRRDVAAAAPA
jgi:hypothetical protein